MPIFLWISRHSPENCPGYNEKTRKTSLEMLGKLEELLKKHGVKLLGGWFVPSEHLTLAVFEAPNLAAYEELGMEPEIRALGAYETTEIKLAYTFEEAVEMLKQAK